MVDTSNTPHHPVLDELSEILCARTEQDAAPFFRILTIYYLGIMASCMRATIQSPAFGEIPINNYVVALAPSGFGKGKSTGALENSLLCDFRKTFRDFVLPDQAEKHMAKLASRISAMRGTSEDNEYEKLFKDFQGKGEYPFVYDGGSEAAIKQIRELLLLADCGSLNLQIDEIGLNLEKPGTTEAMAAYLELYDLGMIKAKVKMNTSDSKRSKELEGRTPANMLLFGTPMKLLDSGPIEKKFYSLLETGYARRCLFAWADGNAAMNLLDDVDEIYARLTNPQNQAATESWCQHFAGLADPVKLNWAIDVPEESDKLILRYQLECKREAQKLSEFDEVRQAELTHRYFRVLKVAGTLAFVDESLVLTKDHVMAAIKVVEESGAGFQHLLNREPAHAKLARYLANIGKGVTHAELFDALPFYKAAGKGDRQDMLSMATSWGYRQHIIIKKSYMDDVELFTGETLRETDIDAVSLSYSGDWAHHYEHGQLAFEDLHELTQAEDLHWSNHAFENGHRHDEKTIPGFDLLVFDIDGTAPLHTVHDLMNDFVFMTSTTKRHTPEQNRFRFVIPMNYELKLDAEDYREFIRNVMSWLPFKVDESTVDRCRKWATFSEGSYHYNLDGQLFDVLPFVPKTKRDEERKKEMKELSSLDNLERWFAQRIGDGNRNNSMLKFALALADSGLDYNTIEKRVLSFNARISNGLSPEELNHTVFVTLAKHLQNAA